MSKSKYRPKRSSNPKAPRWFINMYLRSGVRNAERVQLANYVRCNEDVVREQYTVFSDRGNNKPNVNWEWD